MNELEIKRVPFIGTELMAARDEDGQIWAGVRWMCDGIGLSEGQRKRQIANIQADKVLCKGGSNLILNGSGYGNREVLCLKLDYVPLWLAKISITPKMEEETPELAATLEQYQLRAKDVLAAAFLPEQYQTTRQKAASSGGKSAQKSPSLSAVTAAMKLQISVAKEAGISPEFIQLALSKAYEPYGIAIPSDCLPETEKLYECEAIATELGIMSEKGKPHNKAVAAIIKIVGADENEVKTLPFSTNSYSNVTVKYKRSVLEKVCGWLEVNNYPASFQGADGKNYRVKYRRENRV